MMENQEQFAAIDALRSNGPSRENYEQLMLFGQFIGEWLMDVSFYAADGTLQSHYLADWMFSWILQGKAIQDVLMVPSREERANNPNAPIRCGTTLRFFDTALSTWRVLWMNPFSNTYIPLVGGRQGDQIVLEGPDTDGSPLRWIFSEITPNSFLWTGHTSKDGGRTWYMEQKMIAQRRASGSKD